jgi:hypothetical protein
MEPSTFAYAAMTGVFAAGAAWGAVKTGLNGTKARVEALHADLDEHIKEEHANDRQTHERVARVETKVDLLVNKLIE